LCDFFLTRFDLLCCGAANCCASKRYNPYSWCPKRDSRSLLTESCASPHPPRTVANGCAPTQRDVTPCVLTGVVKSLDTYPLHSGVFHIESRAPWTWEIWCRICRYAVNSLSLYPPFLCLRSRKGFRLVENVFIFAQYSHIITGSIRSYSLSIHRFFIM
jgi:hypothetical protein